MLKNRKHSVIAETTDVARPDQVDEVTVDEEYYFAWETPGEFVNDVFIAKPAQEILIMHVKKTGTVFSYTATFAAWRDRTTATYVPWSKRDNILK